MQVHRFIAFMPGVVLHEARSTAFDLDTASSFLLDVFDIRTTLTYDLSTQVKAGNRLEVYSDLLLRPFALVRMLVEPSRSGKDEVTYAAHRVAFDLLRLSAAETPLVDQVR